MGEEDSEGGSRKRLEDFSFRLEKYPRDLLHRFMVYSGSNSNSGHTYSHPSEYKTPNEETEELELNLGLSLGGKFGVDKSSKKLTRSSSIAGTISFIKQDESTNIPRIGSCTSLIRTTSLPVETEEEWRKRKELQMLRRMEAKRRRSEKQRNFKGEKEGNEEGKIGSDGVVNWGDNSKPKSLEGSSNRASNLVTLPFGLSDWMSKDFLKGGVDGGSREKGGVLIDGGSGSSCGVSDNGGAGKPNSQGSMESQGGSSSGVSESESKSLQGSGNCSEARAAATNQLLQGRVHRQVSCPVGAMTKEMASQKLVLEVANSSKPQSAESRGKEIGPNAMEDMPCVFTKGDGPNGRRIEGILYKYGKGEEVRIMCVCHGKFLSPAEFVKHAGGGEVSHPLRQIVINPNPSFLR